MTFAASPLSAWLKCAVFALLALNAVVYVGTGTASEALDTLAWFSLLALFVLETEFGERLRAARAATAVRLARLVAAAGVVAAAIGYFRDREWLDVVNSALWIAVVALLEVELRLPGAAPYRRLFAAIAAVLYAGLGTTALAWLWQGEWFHGYDALLWLAALVLIEMNVLSHLPGSAESSSGGPP